jgi:hypothetical protein
MKNKQTAVDWLIEVLWAPCQGIPSDIIEQAKQMEKAQIIRARVDGDENHTFNSQMREEYAEDYYKENYGK